MTTASIDNPISPINKSSLKYDFSSELRRVKNIDDFKHRILRVINRLGFSDFSFGLVDRDWEHEDDQTISSYPEEYQRIYKEEQLYMYDMLIEYARESNHPVFTSQVYDYYCNAPFNTEVTCINRAIRQLHHSLGFFENYAMPMIAQNGKDKLLLTLSQQGMATIAFQTKINSMSTSLRLLSHAINDVCSAKFPTLFEQPISQVVDIAPKPLRVLATLANEDLSITEVAKKLCISPITAHQHIASARRALNKNTNIGAIKEAIELGLISYN